jgi:penicillin-binding protein 1A
MSKTEEFLNSIPKVVKLLWIMLFAALISVAVLFIYISNFELPDTQELENPKYEIASQILADNGKELGRAFKYNREWLGYEEINPKIIKALIATEDIRFWSHSGVDFRGTVRAIVFLGTKGGASTITQQLAKQFFTQRSSSSIKRAWQKLKEWVIAVEFERRYTKEEILAMYLNKYDFIYGAIGIGTASKTYFGKNQKELDYHEAALLVGLLKNSYLYNPKVNMERALLRRNTVLSQLLKAETINEVEFEKYKKKKIDLTGFKREEYNTGIATYFRAEVVKMTKSLLEDPKIRKSDGTKYNVYTDGLKIYTTIDYGMQQYAEQAMREHMVALQKKYFTVWKGKDPWSANADADQKIMRASNLLQQFRQSDRFKSIRDQYLSTVTSKILEDVSDARLSDADIFRLLDAEKKSSSLDKLITSNIITEKQARIYKEVLEHEQWPKLKSQWNKAKVDGDLAFNKPVKMKIYDYASDGDKEVVMSPKDSIKHHIMHMQIGSIGVNPKTGNVKFWIGGINHKYFQYDHVNSARQVGSTFKPFIYSTAIIDQAISPCFKVPDIKHCIQANDPDFGLMENWCPSNSDGKNSGQMYTLKEGLKESKNSISVFLMKQLGSVEVVRNFVANLGIDKSKIPEAPSICLGTAELSAFEMASAYTVFANDGTHSKPFFISQIVNKSGNVIYSAIPEQKKAINPSYNAVIVNMLQYVAEVIQKKFKSQVAGKTGTTNSYKDGWYVGFTPEIVISTWVGGDVEWIRFNRLEDGQGAVMARPFFEKFLTKVEKDLSIKYNSSSKFAKPSVMIVETDCAKYSMPTAPEDAIKPIKVDEFELENN